jgi:ferredoxin
MADDGLSQLKNSSEENGDQVLDAVEPGCANEAAEVCPVQIIEIV